MRRYGFVIVFICLAVAVGVAVYNRGALRSKAAPARWKRPEARTVLNIDGMDCVMCAAGLQNTLRAIPGVRRADVSFQDKQAALEYDPAAVDPSRFNKVIADAGFTVSGTTAQGQEGGSQ